MARAVLGGWEGGVGRLSLMSRRFAPEDFATLKSHGVEVSIEVGVLNDGERDD